MKLLQIAAFACLVALSIAPTVESRLWTDSTGKYTLEARLIMFNDKSVILEREDHDLVAFPIDKLSDKDREFLKSQDAAVAQKAAADGMQTWTLRHGTKIVGRIVDYASRDVTLQRRRGRIYVNDRVLDNLPAFYQQLIPKFVAESENLQRSDRASLEAWLVRQRGEPRTFHLDGVVLETENGDEYSVPFALFSEADLKVLQPGWKKWLLAHGRHDASAEDASAFLLRSLAAARARDARVQHEIAMMQLKLQAVQTGLTSLWEVTLFPAAGHDGAPLWVVVPGRDSRQATDAALQQNPGYVAGPVRRVSR